MSKVTYGNFCHIPFEPNNPDHKQRVKNTFTSVSGSKRISDAFDVILPKVRYFDLRTVHLQEHVDCVLEYPSDRGERIQEVVFS